jgi:hypothetical protein
MEFAAAPIFLLMAFIAYLQHPRLCTVPGEVGFLSSMWFMYGVMSVVHSGPWLSLAWQSFKNAAPKEQRQSEKVADGLQNL